jgi:TonB family protein
LTDGKVAGKKLRSKNDWNGTDDYGFSALPSGARFTSGGGSFSGIGYFANWWSADENGSSNAYYQRMGDVGMNEESSDKGYGFSVRCVYDMLGPEKDPKKLYYYASVANTPPSSISEKNIPSSSQAEAEQVNQNKSPDFLKGGALTGGRSRASIQRVVMQNMAALRYAYNKRLRDKPGLAGRIVVKFAINEFGKVISTQVVESTMADYELETTVVSRVKNWDFEKIDKPGDVTEVTYPFVFSQ